MAKITRTKVKVGSPVRIPDLIRRAIANRTDIAGKVKELDAIKKYEDATVTEWLTANKDATDGKITVQIDDETNVSATLVEPTSQMLDEDKLKKLVKPEVFKSLYKTVKVLDEDALKNAVNTGAIKSTTLNRCITETAGTVYTRFTVSKIKADKK